MKKPAFLIYLVLALSSCATGPGPVGIIYSDTWSAGNATGAQPGNRVGEACNTSIFGLVATGDASIESARKNGAITLIQSVDYKSNNVLGIATYCTIVRGR